MRYLVKRIYKRNEKYIVLVRLNKPIGILLLLWPALWALWFAYDGEVNAKIVWVFIVGVVLTRSAGCAINDFADRKYDSRVKRTANRPLVTGQVKPGEAIAIFVILSLLALTLVLVFLNTLCLYLSLIAAVLIFIYPFTKRFTHLPQAVLGAAFAMSVPMAYAIADPDTGIVLEAWVLYIAVIFWTVVYDTMYAMVDKNDDVKVGIKSTAILFGDMYIIILGILQAFVFLSLLFISSDKDMDLPFYLAMGFASLLAGYQLFLISDQKPERCFRAFLNNGWFGCVVFLGIYFNYLIEQESYSVKFYSLLVYISSILLVYIISILKHSNRTVWVFIACIIGPIAIILVPFSKRVKQT